MPQMKPLNWLKMFLFMNSVMSMYLLNMFFSNMIKNNNILYKDTQNFTFQMKW